MYLRGFIFGPMEEYMRGNGFVIRCMEKEFTHGQTDGNMKEIMLTIKNMVSDSILGQMGENTKGVGFKVNNMVVENT